MQYDASATLCFEKPLANLLGSTRALLRAAKHVTSIVPWVDLNERLAHIKAQKNCRVPPGRSKAEMKGCAYVITVRVFPGEHFSHVVASVIEGLKGQVIVQRVSRRAWVAYLLNNGVKSSVVPDQSLLLCIDGRSVLLLDQGYALHA
ncbi:MAG: hypothetical protein ACD_23C01353G0001 [uncultured bacterium]|nr:MAG: hypothetical protein ACD_23C01353G0001 [uncultured bacterium]